MRKNKKRRAEARRDLINWKLMYPDIILQIFKIGFVKIYKCWRFLSIRKAQ